MLAAIVAIGAGYLLQVGLGRAVAPLEFAFLQETLAFYLIAMLPLQPIGAVVTRQSARHEDQFWIDLTRPSLIVVTLVIAMGSFIWSGRRNGAHWDVPTLATFGASVATGVAFLIINSVAVGHLDFVGSTFIQTTQASVRLALALLLVWWGAGARGLWLATAIANGGAALLGKWRLARTVRDPDTRAPIGRRTRRDLAIAACCYAGIAVLTQIDLIYARRVYPEASTYAGAALFGKLTFYLPAAAASVALPMLARGRGTADRAAVMRNAIRLVAAFSLCCFAGLAAFGGLVAGRLLGPLYGQSGWYIQISALAMLPYGLVNLFASASLEGGRVRLAIGSLVVAIGVALVARAYAVSLGALAAEVALGGTVLAFIGWLDTRWVARRVANGQTTGLHAGQSRVGDALDDKIR